jgi:hypothetical protein
MLLPEIEQPLSANDPHTDRYTFLTPPSLSRYRGQALPRLPLVGVTNMGTPSRQVKGELGAYPSKSYQNGNT